VLAARAFTPDSKTSRTGRRAARVVRAAATDPATKISFPDANATGLTVLGAGCRVKRVAIIDVKVYALAMYVDADAARAQKGKGLLNGDYDKELAIELARDVDGKTFMEALSESLGPRIREIATNMATAEDEDGNFMASVAEAAEKAEEAAVDSLDAMRDGFSSLKLKQGTKITISWTPKGVTKCAIAIAGAAKMEFESAEFAKALLDVYVGEGPVAPAAAQTFEKGLAAL
jgi:hypothetical protein